MGVRRSKSPPCRTKRDKGGATPSLLVVAGSCGEYSKKATRGSRLDEHGKAVENIGSTMLEACYPPFVKTMRSMGQPAVLDQEYYEGMRSVYVLAVILSANLAMCQAHPAPSSFAGCYQLLVQKWASADAKKIDFMPKRFQLKAQPVRDGHFLAQNQDPKVRSNLSGFSFWSVNGTGLYIVWADGFVGYGLQFVGSGRELHGTAKYFSDTERPRDAATVVIRHTQCEESEAAR